MYDFEQGLIKRRWESDQFLKRLIRHDIRIIICLVILTAAIPKVTITALIAQLIAVIISGGCARWLIKRCS